MADEHAIARYRRWYGRLLRHYSRPYRDRFAEGMEQTFNDLCRERAAAGQGLVGLLLWVFIETSAGIIRENATSIMRCSMQRDSTMFLKIVISLIAIAALAVCIFGLPGVLAREAAKTPDTAYLAYLFLVGAYFLAFLFLFAVYQAFKLLPYIDGNKEYSELPVSAVTHIKYSAITIGASMVAGIAAVMVLTAGTGDDITGIVAPALLVTFASGVVATVAAVFQRRVQKAIDIKAESDQGATD